MLKGDKNMSSFSSNLERLMNKRDMSDSELAELVDVNRLKKFITCHLNSRLQDKAMY